MHISTTEIIVPDAMTIEVTEDTLTAELSDGRTISVPLAWYPRLIHAHTRGTQQLGVDRHRARASIGPTWTKTLALRGFLPAESPAKAHVLSSAGWRPRRLAFR